ncbi:Zinc finger protein [Spraguea lophii 42_110]|uniref:Zinc finger protein n=1 Tax=Spraguea lophii (strain 42_110) TaxID=1358809 RepID=S7WA22_SPRLO|nr:Zinc finger protein [Spraguea lophii 42_110]
MTIEDYFYFDNGSTEETYMDEYESLENEYKKDRECISDISYMNSLYENKHLHDVTQNTRMKTAAESSDNNKKQNEYNHRKKEELYKTEMCKSYEEFGTCRYGEKCQFAHSIQELRSVTRHPKYRTEICKTFWIQGNCPYFSRCCFIHDSVTEEDIIENRISASIEIVEYLKEKRIKRTNEEKYQNELMKQFEENNIFQTIDEINIEEININDKKYIGKWEKEFESVFEPQLFFIPLTTRMNESTVVGNEYISDPMSKQKEYILKKFNI